MEFSLKRTIEILETTPFVIESYLLRLSKEWVENNEGKDTWSPYDVLGHLIHGEKTDWMVRINIILSESENKLFKSFDRFAQLKEEQNLPIEKIILEFKNLRKKNLAELASLHITERDLSRIGVHPELGEVSLQQLLATWAVHDLGHIAQISRVMAKQYVKEVGPWEAYLGILKK
ncbi:DinB family protein [Flavobacterium sp. NRK F10]|uniref:DinB family protein n=1 Tax=Flavobacterium sp. NRK F10 TaxID=2954931 RepID=UPI00209097D4|nr:DinB family protein [Flavobacterium sp. NRK F10]MCO6175570.1 DinB family protein [Flavobacterium sp. NRK F10]